MNELQQLLAKMFDNEPLTYLDDQYPDFNFMKSTNKNTKEVKLVVTTRTMTGELLGEEKLITDGDSIDTEAMVLHDKLSRKAAERFITHKGQLVKFTAAHDVPLSPAGSRKARRAKR